MHSFCCAVVGEPPKIKSASRTSACRAWIVPCLVAVPSVVTGYIMMPTGFCEPSVAAGSHALICLHKAPRCPGRRWKIVAGR